MKKKNSNDTKFNVWDLKYRNSDNYPFVATRIKPSMNKLRLTFDLVQNIQSFITSNRNKLLSYSLNCQQISVNYNPAGWEEI